MNDRPISPGPRVPLDLSNVPYQQRPFKSAEGAKPGTVLDGLAGWDWAAWSLFLAFDDGSSRSDRWPGLQTTAQANPAISTTVQIAGMLREGLPYVRRFTLAERRSVVLDVSAYLDLRVSILQTTGNPTRSRLVGNVTNHPLNVAPDRVLLLAESYAQAGTYAVPPGAFDLVPYTADAGFAWRAPPAPPLPSATVAGTVQTVRGPMFTTTVPGFNAVWKVSA